MIIATFRRAYLLMALLVAPTVVWAEVRPHPLFSEGMVLQQGRPVPVWGTADDGETVTVQFQGQDATATAENGRWLVHLNELEAGGPFSLTIQCENEALEIPNVLVGEVWICSGQSNMQWPISRSADPDATIASSGDPMLRLLTVPRQATDEPLDEVDVSWSECGPETVAEFSAVAYHFGKALREALGVPVGLINTSLGGTPAEAWTPRERLEADPFLRPILDRSIKPGSPQRPFGLYNAMIHPLIPYAIQGAIWYQGESNAGRAYEYRALFPAMIRSWRDAWGQGDFPFLFVQLAPFQKIVAEPQESNWAELREAQLLTTQLVPNTAMAVITDVGDEDDIHPQQKAPVGQRLALAARALAYGDDLEFAGPTYRSLSVVGNKAILSFDHLGGGLVAQDGPLTGFTIAGPDRVFHNAEAVIEGNTVVVSCPEVDRPIAVRYGWADFPLGNLWNEAGLPASPFRTDDFIGLTQKAELRIQAQRMALHAFHHRALTCE